MCVKEIFLLGKKYPFYRPPHCLNKHCKSQRIWGHGYRNFYFDDVSGPVTMKRYICVDCGTVYTLRPIDYWPRHHLPKKTITERLTNRIAQGTWDTTLNVTRQRQGHWLRALKKNIIKFLGLDFIKDLSGGFQNLMALQKVPIQRSD